jgi:hypothetical protein
MWIGQPSATALDHQIGGIMLAEEIHAIPKAKRLGGFPWDDFEEWIAKHFNPQRLSVRSFWLAVHSTKSEEEAFHRWFEWYDQFYRDRRSH